MAYVNSPVSNAYSTLSNGISGLVTNHQRQFLFLKSSPYSSTNAKDPVSRKVFESRSIDHRNKRERLYSEVEKTKRQIRYNEFTRSGASVPRSHGFEFRSDYHKLTQRDLNQHSLLYAAALVGVIYFLI